MKKLIALIFILSMVFSLVLASCSGSSENVTQEPSAVGTDEPAKSDAPVETQAPTPEPTVAPTPEPTPEPGPAKVTLTNSPESTGNTNYAASHYGMHIAYGNDYVTMMNYMTMFLHGEDTAEVPAKVGSFEMQAEDLQFFNGLLYFLNYDFENGVYYLYSYDFENDPVKVSESTVYHYEFINGKIYFRKEFYQGPIYSMNPDGTGETELTQMRAHGFVHDGQSIYFYSTDAGTAPGLVEYNISTGEERTVVFPFYSHNFLVHGGYVYYSLDTGTYRSIHRASLADQTVEDIWLEISHWTISLNISDGELYMLVGDGIYKSATDGSNRIMLLQAEDNLKTGLYIFGDRIYCMDDSFVYCQKTDGSEVNMYSLNTLQ